MMIIIFLQKLLYATVVPENTVCASMCANIWLAGKNRFDAPSGHIGFHSTSVRGVRSKWGNDDVKSFYEILNLVSEHKTISKETMDALLAASPNDMLWLTPELADKLGIDYETWPPHR